MLDETRRVHGDERRPRQRHVLAAPAKGIISGRRPATLHRWGQAAWCCAAACSMIHEPIDGVWPVGGLVHVVLLVRLEQ
jgi:hypothetical protein